MIPLAERLAEGVAAALGRDGLVVHHPPRCRAEYGFRPERPGTGGEARRRWITISTGSCTSMP